MLRQGLLWLLWQKLVLYLFHLKQSHKYYARVLGQMAIGKRNWCDFAVWTTQGILVERILYDETYVKVLVPKLVEFYKGCIAPEIVSPNIPVGKLVRDWRYPPLYLLSNSSSVSLIFSCLSILLHDLCVYKDHLRVEAHSHEYEHATCLSFQL